MSENNDMLCAILFLFYEMDSWILLAIDMRKLEAFGKWADKCEGFRK